MNNLSILLLNSLLYFITLLYYQRKYRILKIGSIILFLYSAISLLSIDLFFHELSDFKDLKITPFLYLYATIILTSYPLLKFNENEITKLHNPSKIYTNSISIFLILIAFASTWSTIGNISKIPALILNPNTLGDAYASTSSNISNVGDGDVNVIIVLNTLFKETYLFILFYLVSNENSNKLIKYLIATSVILIIINELTLGRRGGLTFMLFDIAFLFLLFRSKMSLKIKRITVFIVTGFITIIIIAFFAITIGRFGKEGNTKNTSENLIFYYTEWYFAQSFLYFNNYGLDAGGYRYGDKTMPLVRKTLGLETSKNYEERRFKMRYMKIHDNYFYTFVGDFTLDYGPIFAFFILAFFSFVFNYQLRRRRIYSLGTFYIAYFLFNILAQGFCLFTYSEISGNLKILTVILIVIYFEIDFAYSKSKKIIK